MKFRSMLVIALVLLPLTQASRSQESMFPRDARHVSIGNREAVAYPNIRIHPNPTTQQFEPAIAVHPSNASIVLVAANAGSGSVNSTGWYYTTDAGATWIGRDTLPTHTNFSMNVGDPGDGIDRDGNLFISAVTGSSSFATIIARSTDGGIRWSQVSVPNPTNDHSGHLATDANQASAYAGNVYVSYSTMGSSPIRFSRSTDLGGSFANPVTINGSIGSPGTDSPRLAVGPDGELYATWMGTASSRPLGFNKSTDGGLSWGTAGTIRMVGDIGFVKGVDYGGCAPSMAVDRSNGSRRGWIYIVYPQRNPSTPDIFLIRSRDGGSSWSNPIRVNQDAGGNDQWLPWITIDPATGNVFVVYYDSRNFPLNDSAEVYVSASTDGGETFGDLLVSDVPFKPSLVPAFPYPTVPYYGGSYIGIAALRDTVWPCWYDNRTGNYQVYTSRIEFPHSGPAQVVLEWPANQEVIKIEADSARCRWQKGTPDVTGYWFEHGSDSLFTSSVIDSTVTDTTAVAKGLLTNNTYWWRVRAKNVLGWGPYSASRYFDVIVTTEVSENPQAPSQFVLKQNYPNPFNPTTTIQYALPHRSHVTLAVYNTLGQKVAMLVNADIDAGFHSTQFDASNLASGVYFYRMQAGNFVQTKKLIPLK